MKFDWRVTNVAHGNGNGRPQELTGSVTASSARDAQDLVSDWLDDRSLDHDRPVRVSPDDRQR